MSPKVRDHLPEELKTKYFDFEPRSYPDNQFCSDLLRQVELSMSNCDFYRETVKKKFNYVLPDELKIDDLHTIPYLPTSLFKKSDNRTLDLLKVPLDEIVLFSCSSSTTMDPSLVPRTVEDFDQIQYNSIKVFSEFFDWKNLKVDGKRCVVFNFAPGRLVMAFMARKNAKGFEYVKKTRYFTACMNKPWEFYGHQEYMIKAKLFKTIWAMIKSFEPRGGFVLDVTNMIKMLKKIKESGELNKVGVSKIIFGGSPLLMNNMLENRLLKENFYLDLDQQALVCCGGGGWDGVKGEAKMGAVNKVKFVGDYEKVFNIKAHDFRDIYAFTEGPTLFGGHWSEKYQDFLLHCPDTSRIIVRSLEKLEPVDEGMDGLLEVITPYGVNGSVNQAVLVDDIVELISKTKCPECGYEGATFRVIGRLTNAQGRSCSSLINWLY